MIKNVLIANRGEIACRIIRACKALGIGTVAVYSDADANALHTRLADQAIHIGGAPAAQSYLDADKVLQAGIQAKADAVHPGYGFLSENTDFARAAEQAGLKWIGPEPDTIATMGDKQRAREIARQCGVPVLPGSDRLAPGQTALWHAQARSVGFPLLVKAVGGGGGIGMKRVDAPEALESTVANAQGVAAKAFGQAEVYLERYVARARHIEIQVFGYGDGHAVHLFERECSVQRRFQKIIEESPAPGVPAEVLQRMADAAVALAAGQRYRGAGTVEFIMDAATQEFFFLEMNTRIQVEHAVTEMITGWDLVQQQILLAGDAAQRREQSDIRRSGAAIEVRIYAENPAKQFLPSPGELKRFELPAATAHLRVDCGVQEGDRITPYYDPMIAKLISFAKDRPAAMAGLDEALQGVHIEGIQNNVGFLRAVLAHEEFTAGRVDTGFVERDRAVLLAAMQALTAEKVAS